MNFNIDDPLAGILSDGSDDSFFDDDILGKKKTPKKTPKKSIPTPEKRSSLFDLDVDEPKPSNSDFSRKKDSVFDLGKIDNARDDAKLPVSPAPFRRTLSKDSVKADSKSAKSPAKPKISASVEPLDILGDSTIESKKETKHIEKGKSSQSLLDDILGESNKTGSSRPTAKSQEFDFDSILGKESSKPSKDNVKKPTTSKVNVQKPTPKVEKAKDQAPKKTKTSEDWLGIFQDEETQDAPDMPAWLGGGGPKKKKTESEAKTKTQPAEEPVIREEETVEEVKVKPQEAVVDPVETPSTPMLTGVMKSSNEDLTMEGAAMYMQQQESQLMVALQLKAQEEKLAAMQIRQKENQRLQREAALAHHGQLDAMLQRQVQHRTQVQAIINAHQERITQRIKALLGTNTDTANTGDELGDELGDAAGESRESPHAKERKQLLQLIRSLQDNHDKEIDLMETSYRRQLAFLEVSLIHGEERMKEESDKLTKFYSEKISWLEEHHELFKKLTEDNMASLNERHKAENEMLRQQHLENVRVLQEHHAALMENIKNAVKQEQALIQDAATFSSELQTLVTDVKDSKTHCQELVSRVQSLAEDTRQDAERNLQVRQTQISDMIQQLKTDRDNLEKEKVESRETIKLLESRLKQMNESIEDEMAIMKQKKMEFEFEKATFSKQTEFAKNVLKKQDEEIKTLKEDIQKEFREKIDRINEEKMQIQKDSVILIKEKSSIQNLRQELERIKAELQVQMEEVSEDRLKLNLEKQQMHMDEQRIMAKGRDLELLVKAAMEKQSHADKKYSEAELIQSKYEERIRRLQEHGVSLNAREKQIAKEKVSLSRERLVIHNEKKLMEGRQQCSLCKSQPVQLYNLETAAFPDSYPNVSVSRDEGDANVMSAMKAIAQELVSLKLKKQMDLRQRTDVGRAMPNTVLMDDVGVASDSLQPQALDSSSGAFKDYMDPKFMMLRLDVQKMLSNLNPNELNPNDEEGDDDAADRE